MAKPRYSNSVFINCPFDDDYFNLRNAVLFSVYDCGFTPRCALEADDSGQLRLDKITRIIEQCKFGVHDISRTELDDENKLPRFNMPLELGVFLGAKRFGDKAKNCLIMDCERYRYQKFISDIAGCDIRSHGGDVRKVVAVIRDWLNTASGRTTIPGGKRIWERYETFVKELPELCRAAVVEVGELTYNDYSTFISEWLRQRS